MKKFIRYTALVFALAFVVAAPRAEAGLFKNLLQRVGDTMENYNRNMWTGDNSLGRTTIDAFKGKKGNFFEAFDAVAAAQKRAQDQALADVKAVWEAVKDIVLWLPRKLKQIAENIIGKLGSMNQGATVKDRWNNLVSASGGGGGASIQGNFSAPAGGGIADDFPGGGSESGAISGSDLESLLSDTPDARGSMDAEEVLRIYGATDERASADAPSAPEGPAAEGYGKLMDLTGAIEDGGRQREARKRIRFAYIVSVDEALRGKDLPQAAELIKSGSKLYVGNPDGMQKAMGFVAQRHPQHTSAIQKAARRMANLAKH